VKFDFSPDSGEEEKEEKENIKSRSKKKKLTKTEKEQEKRINEWIKTVNTTFQEIEEYDLVIE
jgi:Skp family chaperone for outer membrane proteins